jgi:hypothetical protein
MSNATPGHGALFAMEVDPEGAPGTFTTISELIGDVNVSLNRTTTEVTPHNATMDHYVASAVMRREPWDLSVNYVPGDSTHAALIAHVHGNTLFGVRFRGPGSSGPSDEWIASGYATSANQMNPVREGARTLEISFRPTGDMKIDGTLIQ